MIGGGALLATLSGFTLLGSLPVQPMATVAALGIQPHNNQISFIQVLGRECIEHQIHLVIKCNISGIAGLGGTMLFSQDSCMGPLFCPSTSGQCCLVVMGLNGLVCPDNC